MSNRPASKDGPKRYALQQITYFLQPISSREIATHMNRCMRHGFTSLQCATLLSNDPAVTITPSGRLGGGSSVNLYSINEAANENIRDSRRKVDKYLFELIDGGHNN